MHAALARLSPPERKAAFEEMDTAQRSAAQASLPANVLTADAEYERELLEAAAKERADALAGMSEEARSATLAAMPRDIRSLTIGFLYPKCDEGAAEAMTPERCAALVRGTNKLWGVWNQVRVEAQGRDKLSLCRPPSKMP